MLFGTIETRIQARNRALLASHLNNFHARLNRNGTECLFATGAFAIVSQYADRPANAQSVVVDSNDHENLVPISGVAGRATLKFGLPARALTTAGEAHSISSEIRVELAVAESVHAP
jgi:hypothetical protein